MSLIQLRHDKRIRYPASSKRNLPLLAADDIDRFPDACIVTFRPVEDRLVDEVRRNVSACTRLLNLPHTDLVLVGLETDSPLAPLLFWDVAHALPVGRTITLLHEQGSIHYLEQSYFSTSFSILSKTVSGIVFEKNRRLPAELDSGLDNWTFGIPVGPEDATLLNVVVKRILELQIPKKEILLCGRPGPQFKYWEHVRIVGEDITAPPVQICAKKNRLASEAAHENLCIIHDRVFLPLNFLDAVKKFGDNYPFVAFQCIYFDDKNNLIGRRYSDFNTAPQVLTQAVRGITRDNNVSDPSLFSPSILAITEKAGFYYASPLRHSRANYLTGSLYLCKRSVWQLCPQNENLFWTEFEDIDHGFRADAMGVPSRVNPFAMTQSLISRPLLSLSGSVQYESMGGGRRTYRAALEPFNFPRKPLLKVTYAQSQANLNKFSTAFVPPSLRLSIASNTFLSSRLRVRGLVKTVKSTRVPIQKRSLTEFLEAYEKNLVFDQSPFNWKEWAIDNVLANGSRAISELIVNDSQLVNHLSQRKKSQMFAKSLNEYLPKRGISVCIGSFISAVLLRRLNRKVFYFPLGIFALYRAIRDTTPFADYTDTIK